MTRSHAPAAAAAASLCSAAAAGVRPDFHIQARASARWPSRPRQSRACAPRASPPPRTGQARGSVPGRDRRRRRNPTRRRRRPPPRRRRPKLDKRPSPAICASVSPNCAPSWPRLPSSASCCCDCASADACACAAAPVAPVAPNAAAAACGARGPGRRRRRRRRRPRPEPLRFPGNVSAARRRAGRPAAGAVFYFIFLTARARLRRRVRRRGSWRATLAARVLVVPLGVFRDGHEQRPPAREPFFRPRLAREQRAELIRGDVRFFQLLLHHDPRARLAGRVFFAEQALHDPGFGRVPVPRRDADELHEKLNRVRIVVPVRAGFERLGAVVVGQKPIELLAFVLLAFVEQTAHTARDLHAE